MPQSSSYIYSPYKIAHHQDKIQELRNKQQPVPLQVQLVISDLCNHDCHFCAYRMPGYTSNEDFGVWDEKTEKKNNNPNRMISTAKTFEILEDCAALGVKAIQFTGGGEPTVHPDHEAIFEKTLEHQLELALVTNGYRFSDKLGHTLLRGQWVRFSLDAGTKETYSSVRRVPLHAFDKTISNIKKMVELKKQNTAKVIIGVGFVVDIHNYSEVYLATKICHDLGVDNIRLSATFTPDDVQYHAKHYDIARAEALKAVEDFNRPDFRVFNMFGDRIGDLQQKSPNYSFCGYMHLNTYIGGNLKVYTCCNNAYNKFGEMGDLSNQRFMEFWLSHQKKQKFDQFNPRKCARCMFNAKNHFINYLLEPDPPHKNYI